MSQQRAQSRPGTIGPSLFPRVANPIARNAGVFFGGESCLFIFVLNAVAAIFGFFIKVDWGELNMAPLGVPQHLHTFGIQHGMASINIWRQTFWKPKKTPAMQATTPVPFPQQT